MLPSLSGEAAPIATLSECTTVCCLAAVLLYLGSQLWLPVMLNMQSIARQVYRLNNDGLWDDKGTGHVSVEFMEVRLGCQSTYLSARLQTKTLPTAFNNPTTSVRADISLVCSVVWSKAASARANF